MAKAKQEQPAVRYTAAWFGGPPGRNWDRIQERMRTVGVETPYHIENYNMRSALKPDVNLVFICKMMHTDKQTKAAIALAEERGIPFCIAETDFTTTYKRMVDDGLIEDLLGAATLTEACLPDLPHLALVPPPEGLSEQMPPEGLSEQMPPERFLRDLTEEHLQEVPWAVAQHLFAAQAALAAYDRAEEARARFDEIDLTDDETLFAFVSALSPAARSRLTAAIQASSSL